MTEHCDALVVGGGFFGCLIACRLRQRRRSVVLVEAGPDLCRRASYGNQARVHNGHHYPRSLLTALRSRVNFPRFATEFADSIVRDFTAVYAVARSFSKVTADYFEQFCGRVGAGLTPAPASVTRLFDPALVEGVYLAEEFAFDADRLREHARQRLVAAGVTVRVGAAVRSVRAESGGLVVGCDGAGGPCRFHAAEVFNCAYADLNSVLAAAGVPGVPLKHELAEVALVEVPNVFRKLGVTVMCGPFWSCMPFPARGLHSLTHVRYTPHRTWTEGPGLLPAPAGASEPAESRFGSMVRDAARFVPVLADCQHRESLWQVKTVLPASEADDGRPILFRTDVGLPGLHCVLGAKLDNVYDVLDAVDAHDSRRACA